MRIPLPAAALAVLIAPPVLAAPPQVATDTAITGALLAEVMGDLGTPRVLLPAGTSLHSYQMRPSEAAALQEADLLVWFGPELTPWLSRAAALRDSKGDLELLHIPGTLLRPYGEDGAHGDHDEDRHDEAHADDHADGHHEDGDHEDGHHEDGGHDHDHDHDHAGVDPHAWLDPGNASRWYEAIAARLSDLDPENAAQYADNAARAAERIAALDARIAGKLKPLQGQDFVVFHDAYGYFTTHYGLPPAIAVSLGDATSPSAARLTEVRQRITKSGARCAFPEFSHDAKLIATVSDGTGITIGRPLDPEGASIAPGAGLYGAVLEGLADTLADCLSAK